MATNIETLIKPNGDQVLPRTRAKAVSMEDGTTVETAINNISDKAIFSPSNAQIGQIIVVSEVDENGKPLDWEAIDIPSDLPNGGETGNILVINDEGKAVWGVINITEEAKTFAQNASNSAENAEVSASNAATSEANAAASAISLQDAVNAASEYAQKAAESAASSSASSGIPEGGIKGTVLTTTDTGSAWLEPKGWKTVLEEVWELETITPLSFDPETSYFTCAAEDIAEVEAGGYFGTIMKISESCTDAKVLPIRINQILRAVYVVKVNDTTFYLAENSNMDILIPANADTIDVSMFVFNRIKHIDIQDISTRKYRLTLSGQFSVPLTRYENAGLYGSAGKTYVGMNTSYFNVRSTFGDIVLQKEIIAPYKTIGNVIGGGYFLCSYFDTYNNKYLDVTSACLPTDVSNVTNDKNYIFDSTGYNFKRLISHSAPWFPLGSTYGEFYRTQDHLLICDGCYVKLEIWVD